jgi:VWFA-related protein
MISISLRWTAAFCAAFIGIAGCRSFDKAVKPLVDPGVPADYKPPIYKTGTKPASEADWSKVMLEIWRIRSEDYPDSIQLHVNVFDSAGKIITNLAPPYYQGKDDYRKIWAGLSEQLGDGGKMVDVTDFSVREFSDQDGIPYEIALALDYSGTMGSNVKALEEGAQAFIRLKRPQDRISVVKFDGKPRLVVPPTDNDSLLLGTLGHGDMKGFGGYTAIYAGVHLGEEQMVAAPADHPRALILFTDGEDNASTISSLDLYSYSRTNGIPIFTIAFGMVNREVLGDISSSTGGRFYQTYSSSELKSAFEDIYRSLRNYYLVTYRHPPLRIGKHLVTVKLDPPGGNGVVAGGGFYNTLKGMELLADRDQPMTFRNILFDYDQATLRPESYDVLQAIAEKMRENPRLKFEIRGHTDAQGTQEHNQVLSEARAESVRKALIDLGIDENRLRARGFGMSMPVASNATEEGRQLNRRTELIVIAR